MLGGGGVKIGTIPNLLMLLRLRFSYLIRQTVYFHKLTYNDN